MSGKANEGPSEVQQSDKDPPRTEEAYVVNKARPGAHRGQVPVPARWRGPGPPSITMGTWTIGPPNSNEMNLVCGHFHTIPLYEENGSV